MGKEIYRLQADGVLEPLNRAAIDRLEQEIKGKPLIDTTETPSVLSDPDDGSDEEVIYSAAAMTPLYPVSASYYTPSKEEEAAKEFRAFVGVMEYPRSFMVGLDDPPLVSKNPPERTFGYL